VIILSTYKEIVTKAIIGKGKKYYKNTYTIDTEFEPTTVLGCWVINHKFRGSEVSNHIVIDGSFDVNIWYSYANDTKTTVITKTLNYNETVNVRQRETTDSSTKDIIVRSLKQPNCVNAKENGKSISIDIEKELGVEIVGDTKVKIAIEEDEEPWDIIDDNVYDEKVEKEIDNSVKEEYIKEDILEEK
jgi:spore coat protein E